MNQVVNFHTFYAQVMCETKLFPKQSEEEKIDYCKMVLKIYYTLFKYFRLDQIIHEHSYANCMCNIYTGIPQSMIRRLQGPYGTRNETLASITQDSMTVDDLDTLLRETEHNGYPVVVSKENQYLVGFVLRRDLNLALANARRTIEGLTGQTLVLFHLNQISEETSNSIPLHRIVDLAPITVTDQTPMETVVDMFRKLGLRQTLVTHNGRLLGVITKKDVLRHVKAMGNEDPSSVLFN